MRVRAIVGACALLASHGPAAAGAQVFYGSCPAPSPVMVGGRLTVFAPDRDSQLTHLYYESGWRGWLALLDGPLLRSPAPIAVPAAIAGPRGLQVFGVSPEGHLIRTSHDSETSAWTPWEAIGADKPLSGSPSAVLAGSRLVVFAIGAGGRPTHIFQDAGSATWSDWHDLPLEGIVDSVSAVMAGDRLTVFAPGPGARLLHAFYDPAHSAWTPWLPIERASDPDGYYTMGPASALMHGDRLTVFATDTTRMRVVYRFFDPDSREWTAWAPLEGRDEIVSPPGAVVAGARLVVFATDRFGALVHRYLEGGKWSGWVPLASGVGGCAFVGPTG